MFKCLPSKVTVGDQELQLKDLKQNMQLKVSKLMGESFFKNIGYQVKNFSGASKRSK